MTIIHVVYRNCFWRYSSVISPHLDLVTHNTNTAHNYLRMCGEIYVSSGNIFYELLHTHTFTQTHTLHTCTTQPHKRLHNIAHPFINTVTCIPTHTRTCTQACTHMCTYAHTVMRYRRIRRFTNTSLRTLLRMCRCAYEYRSLTTTTIMNYNYE